MNNQVAVDHLSDALRKVTGGLPFIFAILPFQTRGHTFEVLRVAVEGPDIQQAQVRCVHAGMIEGAGIDLLTKIQFFITRADLVVADISDASRPNVFYELGYAAALNKPTVLLLHKDSKAPSDLLGLEVLRYSESIDDLSVFKQRLKDAIDARLSRDVALLRDMLLPEAGRPAFILCSPAHPTKDSQYDRKLFDERTFGDYLGVVGLLSAFGQFFGEHKGYELISAQYYPPDLLDRPVSLYLIGSPKVNPATGELLKRLAKIYDTKWTLNQETGYEPKGNYPCVLERITGDSQRCYPRMDDPDASGDRVVHSWDYGLVIRAPHPQYPDRLVLIMAGPRSVGTAAACLAATRAALIRKIQQHLPFGTNIADKRVAFWAVLKGTVIDKYELLDAKDVKVYEAGLMGERSRIAFSESA